MIFNVNFLPAKYGDCIWIEYGEAGDTKRILIDGGTSGTKKHIRELLDAIPGDKHFELIVVTHIDRDHLEGILSLLDEDELDFTVGAIWFNGWNHLPGNDPLEHFGAVQGERLTASILKHELPWNKKFDGKAVMIHDDQPLPEITLDGGMKLTLLSPTMENLAVLRDKWEKEVEKANLIPGFGLVEPQDDGIEPFGADEPDVEALFEEEFHEDEAAANGSSIAFLASYGGKSVLFAGDSFPGVILRSLNKLYEGKAPVDLVKLSHHASAHNTSPELITKLDCKRFVISTNGSIYKHPSQVTVARVIRLQGPGTELIFNYKTAYNRCWDLTSLKEKYNYVATFPQDEGIEVSV